MGPRQDHGGTRPSITCKKSMEESQGFQERYIEQKQGRLPKSPWLVLMGGGVGGREEVANTVTYVVELIVYYVFLL